MENLGSTRNNINMGPEQSGQLEYILGCVSVGVAILDCTEMRIRYANAHLLSLLEESWHPRGVIGHRLEEVVPNEIYKVAQPLLQEVCSSARSTTYSEVPFEGFLKTRGRTYWHIEIQPAPNTASMPAAQGTQNTCDALLVTVEDQTNLVHSRLRLNAFHNVSSAIAGPYALPRVLDRILQAVQDMVGSTRCAIMLIEQPEASAGLQIPGLEEQARAETHTIANASIPIRVAAQSGLHAQSQDWHPELSQHLLVGRVITSRHTMVITDTSRIPELELPLVDDEGLPRRPGSVLCVPIFEPISDEGQDGSPTSNGTPPMGSVLGTIEVYHRRTRGFPAEEVELLEQFAQQAGLAIQKARLFRDINRLAQVANRHARQRENIMQAIPDGVIIYDARWHVADINHAARKLLGWSDDMIGVHVSEALARSLAIFRYDPRNIPNIVAMLERRALEGSIDEIKIVGADGQPYTMRRSQTPIRDNRGDIFAFVVVYHDVTDQAIARERIEAEVVARTAELEQRNQALQTAKAAQEMEHARLQLLLERLPSGVILVSAPDKRITLINNIGAHLLQRMGWVPETASPTSVGTVHRTPTSSAGQVSTINHGATAADDMDAIATQAIGTNIEILLRTITIYGPSGSALPYEQQPLALAFSKGEANEAELHFTQADGQPLYLLVNAAPLRTNDGTISSAVTVWHDITQLKTLERAREDFFTTMAHELKTPLANIRAHVSALLANDLQLSAQEQHDFLVVADEQVERLVDMINHFLDASRVEAGALRLELEPILLPEMLEDLQDRLEGLITFSQRRLEIHAAPDLPAVMADYELIMSVLTNLLSNAFRYAPEGDTVLLEVEPVSDKKDQQLLGVELRVIDHGPGITQEQQAQLFTRFSTFAALRRPAADRPGQSAIGRRRGSIRWSPATGLGLYISRGIIEAHGSTLTLKNTPGGGATFAIILPAANPIKREGG
jgi:PAS domain S-box-containing protein